MVNVCGYMVTIYPTIYLKIYLLKALGIYRYNYKFYITVGDRDPSLSPLYMGKRKM